MATSMSEKEDRRRVHGGSAPEDAGQGVRH